MANTASIAKPRVLLDGLAYVESPRWHDGRLWFSHWGMEQIIAVDLDGNDEVVGTGPPGLGWANDWLPDGRRVVTGKELVRVEPDGSTVRHTDLSAVAPYGCSEIVVDGRGNVFVNSINFDFLSGEDPGPAPGVLVHIDAAGEARLVAKDLAFPNGMVVTPDNSTLIVGESFASRLTAFDIGDDGSLSNRRVWAEPIGPDGITIDAEGAIWASTGQHDCVRVREGGEIVDRIALDRDCFACMLGGPERRQLFMLCAQWQGTDGVEDALAKRTGQILVTDVPVPGVGWP